MIIFLNSLTHKNLIIKIDIKLYNLIIIRLYNDKKENFT